MMTTYVLYNFSQNKMSKLSDFRTSFLSIYTYTTNLDIEFHLDLLFNVEIFKLPNDLHDAG